MFEEVEGAYWKENPQDKGEKKIEMSLFQMMSKFTSLVILTGFIGMDSMEEQYKGEKIEELMLHLSNFGTQALKDPLCILLG